MKNIAIVPARAGSKGVPGKNLKILGGQTLTHRALHAAISARIFEKIILTTDIPVLLEENPKAWVVHSRPSDLAQDDTPMVDVVLDVLKAHGIPDQTLVWLLQPTSPFRESIHFQRILEVFRFHNPGSVIGVTHVGDSHPSRHYKLSKDQDLIPLLIKLASFDNRQNLKPVYERNGLYYVARCQDIKLRKSFYIHPCKPFITERLQSFNINDEIDFRLAQAVQSWM